MISKARSSSVLEGPEGRSRSAFKPDESVKTVLEFLPRVYELGPPTRPQAATLTAQKRRAAETFFVDGAEFCPLRWLTITKTYRKYKRHQLSAQNTRPKVDNMYYLTYTSVLQQTTESTTRPAASVSARGHSPLRDRRRPLDSGPSGTARRDSRWGGAQHAGGGGGRGPGFGEGGGGGARPGHEGPAGHTEED